MVHRLDRDTSGVMLFAKSASVKKKLMDNWDEYAAERLYCGIAEGEINGEKGIIDLPLSEGKSGRVMVKNDGKPAITCWKKIKTGNGYTLLSLELKTGRRNQIRAHLAAIGHPVAGDTKYGAGTNPIKRLCLHAGKITLKHPRDGKLMEFEIPAPEEFNRLTGTSNQKQFPPAPECR